MQGRATVALVMIVKDEVAVLPRCLSTVRPFVDAWLVVDTGSSDGTQALVRETMADLPGELVERPWVDFGHNRTEALELARGRADYALVIDADEELVVEPGFRLPALEADLYLTLHQVGDTEHRFWLGQLVRLALPFRYVGVLHEVLDCTEPHRVAKLPGWVCKGNFDGARNADPVAKYRRDAEVLARALEREPDNARYAFYLAQSHRDAGDLELALEAYARRASMGGFAEERWYARLQIAELRERRGDPLAEVVGAYLEAYEERPARAEPLCELARLHRERGKHATALLFAERAAAATRPDDLLFVDESVYAWRARDELAVACYWTGDRTRSAALTRALLADPRLPEKERARVEQNLRYAERRRR